MPDREKVIKGLECHHDPYGCLECPYWDRETPLKDCDSNKLIVDALTLIREQEPAQLIVRCKNCKHYDAECITDGCGWCNRRNFGTNDEWYCADGEVGTYAAN